jgi:hypothetical protein
MSVVPLVMWVTQNSLDARWVLAENVIWLMEVEAFGCG